MSLALRKQNYGDLLPHPESDEIDGITYDCQGRMEYHPDFHFNHGKPFAMDELEYICAYLGFDNARSVGFALGRTEHTVRTRHQKLKKAGLVEIYRDRYFKRDSTEDVREGG